jgi:hypothetical protein
MLLLERLRMTFMETMEDIKAKDAKRPDSGMRKRGMSEVNAREDVAGDKKKSKIVESESC